MYQLEVTHRQDYSFTVNSCGHEFVVDAKEKGLTPLDALLAGLGTCIGVYIRKYSDGGKLGLENFKLVVNAELSKEPPLRFEKIEVCLDLKGAQLDERRKEALLEFVKNCPAHNTLKNNPEVEIVIC